MRDRLPIIMSTTALLVAVLGVTPLGEAAYNAVVPKNSVGAQQLRKGAVTNAKLRGDAVTSGKVKNRSLKAIDFKPGQLPSGPVGPTGPKGDKGETGATGLTGYEIVSVQGAPTSLPFSFVVANCPVGKKVIGGGVTNALLNGTYYTDIAVHASYPTSDTGWAVVVSKVKPVASTFAVTGFAICANVQ